MRNRRRYPWQQFLACTALAVAALGCQKHEIASAGTDTAEPAGEGACRLLRSKEVAAVFAGAKSGQVDDSRKQYGITACTWPTERGKLVVQFWNSENSSAKDEAETLVLGVLDPMKGAARNNVRYENVPGIGEQAVAVVETRDEARGVISDCAILVAQHGDRILMVFATELARSERAKALADLTSLAKNAVARL